MANAGLRTPSSILYDERGVFFTGLESGSVSQGTPTAKAGGAKGDVFTLVRGLGSSGILAYDTRRQRVLIPEPAVDRLFFVDLWP